MIRTRLACSLIALLISSTPGVGAELKSDMIHVSAAMVTMGDVFAGAPDPELEIAKAPPAGKTSMIDYSTLSAIAASHHVSWLQPGLNGKIIIFRDAEAPVEAAADGKKIVPTAANLATAAEPLKAAMLEQHIADKMAITFDPGIQQRYLANLGDDAALVVENLDYTQPTHKFTAVMVDAVTGERQALTGRAIPVIDVPVPTHPIREGELIRPEDITSIEITADKVRSDTAQNADAIVGKVAKRSLDLDQQIQTRFVGQPVLIKRGDRVTMVIQNGPMTLTAEGRALNDAGLGETVRLVNAASNRNLDGIATASGMVEVHTGSAMVAALIPATVSR